MRGHVEHVFVYQKGIMGLFERTIGLERAKLKSGLANIAYNMRRYGITASEVLETAPNSIYQI